MTRKYFMSGLLFMSLALATQAAISVTVTASESADELPVRSSTENAPGITATQLETIRKNSKQQAAQAAFALGIAAVDRMDFAAAQTLVREAIQLQPSNPGYLQAAASLAFHQGELAEAEAYQTQSLALAGVALEQGDIRIAKLMDDLGTIYLARERYAQAERLWQESLVIYEQVLGTMHAAIAPHLNDLAGLAMRDGRADETEQLLKRALHILEVNADTDHTDIATAKHNLADFYVDLHRTAEAEVLYSEALEVWKAGPAQQRLQLAADLNELGDEYLSQNRLVGAKSQFELVIGLLEEDFGSDHQYVRSARLALDKLKSEQANLGEGKELDQQVFEVLRSQFSQRGQIM